MKLLPKGTSNSLRKKKQQIKRRLRNKKETLKNAKTNVIERRNTLKDLRKGFIQRFVMKDTPQLRRDDKRIK